MATVNLLTDVYVGEFGDAIVLTLIDDAGVAVNVSAYTSTKTLRARTPDAQKTVSWTVTFVTDGSNGQVQFTPAAATEIDRPGDWECQVELTAGGKSKKSFPFIMRVGKGIA
jgi:hypothetical protein